MKVAKPQTSVSKQTALGILNKEQHKLRLRLVFSVAILLIVGLTVVSFKRPASAPGNDTGQQSNLVNVTRVRIDDQPFLLQLATTEAQHEQGLSGQASIDPAGGMLFRFDQPNKTCFWMKDMHFNLAILWFDEAQQLIDVKRNLSPQTYPQSYCPPSAAKYVVEIRPDTAVATQVKIGDKLELEKQ